MKTLIITLAMIISAVSLYCQQAKPYRKPIETNHVPQKVRTEFRLRYPDSFVKMWYVTHITYWHQDYGPGYYNSWYKPRTVVVYDFSEPANYEVEFLLRDENSRAIFNRYGVWFETRTQVYLLPDSIQAAITSSEFSGWKQSEYKERIEVPGLKGSVYRLQVSSKQAAHVLRISDDGKIVQIKTE